MNFELWKKERLIDVIKTMEQAPPSGVGHDSTETMNPKKISDVYVEKNESFAGGMEGILDTIKIGELLKSKINKILESHPKREKYLIEKRDELDITLKELNIIQSELKNVSNSINAELDKNGEENNLWLDIQENKINDLKRVQVELVEKAAEQRTVVKKVESDFKIFLDKSYQ
ncbi:MAG TPA: hypothetical protein VIH31_02340 [Candidatus Paceibacterota bacterium]